MEQNKVRSYTFYALGEILLVMIGILLALQVNNWNEERKIDALETSYLERLREDAQWNIEELSGLIQLYYNRAERLNKVAKLFRMKAIEADSLPNRFRPNFIQAWRVKNATYNELVSTGNVQVIADLELRELLSETESYYEFGNRQLEYWRGLSITDADLFNKYIRNEVTFTNVDTSFTTFVNKAELAKDQRAIEAIEYWSSINLVFADGVGNLREFYIRIVERISCLQNDDCSD